MYMKNLVKMIETESGWWLPGIERGDDGALLFIEYRVSVLG